MGMKYIIYEITPLNKTILYSYIGSTKLFRTRKCDHKSRCNNENSKQYNYPLYKFIRENGGWEAFEMNPIEEIEVESKTQARIKEQFWKEDRETKFQMLNVWNPYSDKAEYFKNYYQENIEKMKELHKKYRDENKQKINEKANENYICPCGGKFTTSNKARHLNSLKHQAYVKACLTPTTL